MKNPRRISNKAHQNGANGHANGNGYHHGEGSNGQHPAKAGSNQGGPNKQIDPTGQNAAINTPPGNPDQIAAGGAKFANLDGTNEKDRAMVRRYISRNPKRWRNLDDDKKAGFVDDLVAAKAKAREVMDGTYDPEMLIGAVEAINSCARTAVLMEGQCQRDEEREEEHERLDEGKATANVAHAVVVKVRFDQDG